MVDDLSIAEGGAGSSGRVTLQGPQTVASVRRLLLSPDPRGSAELTIRDGASLSAFSLQNAGSITISTGGTLRADNLSTDTGTIDLHDLRARLLLGRAYFSYPPAADALRRHIAAGRIFSPAFDADPLGLLSFARTLAPDAMVLSVALIGDTNFDGLLDNTDYTRLNDSLSHPVPRPDWTHGDFNADGSVDTADFLLIDRTRFLHSGTTPTPTFLALRASRFGPDYPTQLLALIPEPSAIGCTVAAALALRRQHRRSNLTICGSTVTSRP